MANEFICSRCGKDGTRCGCPGRASYHDEDAERDKRIRENEATISRNLSILRNSK